MGRRADREAFPLRDDELAALMEETETETEEEAEAEAETEAEHAEPVEAPTTSHPEPRRAEGEARVEGLRADPDLRYSVRLIDAALLAIDATDIPDDDLSLSALLAIRDRALGS